VKISQLSLGVVSGIGGFLEAGSIVTSAQAGATFRFQLIWAVVIATTGLVFMTEMSGRLAAISKRALTDAIRERFGFPFFALTLVVGLVLSFLVLATELGAVSTALQMASGISYRWWVLPVAFLGWLFIWKGTFSVVENVSAILGLISVAFAVGAIRMHPQWGEVASGIIPTLPSHDGAKYWFTAVSIIGASISPYLYFVYSSGAIEEKWDESQLLGNRITSVFGNGMGGLLAIALLIIAALVFEPRGVQINQYQQISYSLVPSMGHWGFIIFVATLAITAFGATTEIMLAAAYMTAQGFGWHWSEDAKPDQHARYSLVYTLLVLLASVPLLLGVDPFKLTNFTMSLSAASLPISVLPLMVLMNDEELMGDHRNGWLTNTALGSYGVLSIVLLLVAVPLQIMGGGG
jgi:Mn2+/Fe2+ NRAMP family transporter